jgi:EmrB/QacA subfamily drug resistance transporter
VLVGTFMPGLDFFIVNVTIPSVQQQLHAGPAAIQFVIAGFALAYGAGLITGARLGDIFGRRRLFCVGMGLFTLASVACGTAPNAGVLVAARVAQGAAAALMAPQVLTILGTAFAGEARAKAFNAYGVAIGISAVIGQLLGGLLIKADIFGWDWRTCFLINVPIGVVTLLLAPRVVPESRVPGGRRLDLVGIVLVTAALVAVILPLIEGREQSWPVWAWACLGCSVPLFALFVGYENRMRKRGGSPLVDLSAFRDRAFTAGVVAQIVYWSGQASYFLVFALYVQQGRGMSPLAAGVIFVPIGVGYMATSLSARFFAARLGRQVIAAGAALRIVGVLGTLVVIAWIGTGGNVGWLVPALVVDGAGMGLALAPLASTVMARIAPERVGTASGVLTTGMQVGSALGVALIGVVFYRVLADSPVRTGFAHAFSSSLVFVLGVAVVLVLVVQLLPRRARGQ